MSKWFYIVGGAIGGMGGSFAVRGNWVAAIVCLIVSTFVMCIGDRFDEQRTLEASKAGVITGMRASRIKEES